jgi:hypothetical protein
MRGAGRLRGTANQPCGPGNKRQARHQRNEFLHFFSPTLVQGPVADVRLAFFTGNPLLIKDFAEIQKPRANRHDHLQ